jgi:hypothetical protein
LAWYATEAAGDPLRQFVTLLVAVLPLAYMCWRSQAGYPQRAASSPDIDSDNTSEGH